METETVTWLCVRRTSAATIRRCSRGRETKFRRLMSLFGKFKIVQIDLVPFAIIVSSSRVMLVAEQRSLICKWFSAHPITWLTLFYTRSLIRNQAHMFCVAFIIRDLRGRLARLFHNYLCRRLISSLLLKNITRDDEVCSISLCVSKRDSFGRNRPFTVLSAHFYTFITQKQTTTNFTKKTDDYSLFFGLRVYSGTEKRL